MSYFDPNKFYHAYQRIDEQDRRWLSALPDAPFRTKDAQIAWGLIYRENARQRLNLLKESGLVRFVFYARVITGPEERGRWIKCKEAEL